MIQDKISLYDDGEYTYKAAYGFVPNLHSYVHEDEKERITVLVVPGGAYCMVVPPEGEIVAKEFYNMGMDAFVLTYSTDITTAVPLKKQPLYDISRGVKVARKVLADLGKNNQKLFICGFSAGGHLCATLATHYFEVEDKNIRYAEYSNRPDGAILCYPVISFEQYVEDFSRLTLIGPEPTKEEIEFFSLEKCVTKKTIPCFLWHTATDGLVPVQNNYLFAQALLEKNIPFTQHIFSHGDHGLSCASKDFFEGKFGEEYTFEQLNNAVAAVKAGTAVDITEKRTQELLIQFSDEPKEQQEWPKVDPAEFEDVHSWLSLAEKWMRSL